MSFGVDTLIEVVSRDKHHSGAFRGESHVVQSLGEICSHGRGGWN